MSENNNVDNDNNNVDGNCLLDKSIMALPGDFLLKHEKDIIPSNGTYLRNGNVYASIAGFVKIHEKIDENQTEDNNDNSNNSNNSNHNDSMDTSQNQNSSSSSITKRIVQVIRPGDRKVPFLEPGSIVTCRVVRITSSFAKCSISAIEDHILKQPYTGIIRLDDICEMGSQKIGQQTTRTRPVNKCFRPGDIVLARVIAAGENHQFLLTTASLELGVVVAQNDWGEPMIPISLNEVMCQRTYTKEPRKVAKID